MSAAAAPSDSTCCLSNAICCCCRLISSSRACAASRAAVVRASASASSIRSRSSSLRLRPRAPPRPVSRSRASASRARADSIASPSCAVPPREQHLLPAPQLVAQPLVAPRLGRLTLQRAALLLHLEDDVVDAREVLLRGLELQLRGAPARLVLRDAGRFFDQLPAIGRPRAEDLADLALLDDRVGLGAEAGVHQQIVHVAQPARPRRRSGTRSRPSDTAGASPRRRATIERRAPRSATADRRRRRASVAGPLSAVGRAADRAAGSWHVAVRDAPACRDAARTAAALRRPPSACARRCR